MSRRPPESSEHEAQTSREPTASLGVLWLTGFGAFPGVPDNPTQHIVAALGGRRIGDFVIHSSVLPVTFGDAPRLVREGHAALSPALSVHLGVAGRRRLVCLERDARNTIHPGRKDAVGALATKPRIELSAAAAARQSTRFKLGQIVGKLRNNGFGTRISVDAGDYLCNLTYWHSLASRARTPSTGQGWSLFIHVPPVGAVDPECRVEWDLARLTQAVHLCLTQLAAQLSGQGAA